VTIDPADEAEIAEAIGALDLDAIGADAQQLARAIAARMLREPDIKNPSYATNGMCASIVLGATQGAPADWEFVARATMRAGCVARHLAEILVVLVRQTEAAGGHFTNLADELRSVYDLEG